MIKVYKGPHLVDYRDENEDITTILKRYEQRIVDLQNKTTTERFVDFVNRMPNRQKIIYSNLVRVTHNLSQQEIADYIGCTRQNIFQIIKGLKRDRGWKVSRRSYLFVSED